MSDAAGNETNIGGNPDEAFVDLSDQRVRVVRVDRVTPFNALS